MRWFVGVALLWMAVSPNTGTLVLCFGFHPTIGPRPSSYSVTRYSSPSSCWARRGTPSQRRPNRSNRFDDSQDDEYDNDDDDWRDSDFDDHDDDFMWNNPSASYQSRRSEPQRSTSTISSSPRKQLFHSPTTEQPGVDTATPISHFFSRKSLQQVQSQAFPDSLLFVNLCRGAGIQRPSKIQSLAWPILSQGKHSIVADQTGSGKTLAYLIPLLMRALQFSSSSSSTEDGGIRIQRAPAGTPRILILSPTAELADQTRAVCDKLSMHVPFRTMVVTAQGKFSTSIRDQIRLLQRTSVDVLISTPGRLSTILRTRNAGLDLSQLSAIVLDEVDVLMVDETFGPQLRTVGAAAPVDQTQFVFVTATLPNDIVETIEREFPGVVQARGPGLHRVAPIVQERLVDVSVPPSQNRNANYCFEVKADHLSKALRETRCRRTLIFCNTVESCRKVENFLKRSDRRGQVLEVIPYHNALTPEVRNDNLRLFSTGHSDDDTADYVLVCTDRAARGVDFDASPVDHVVIFDFPKDPAEYIRRVGRTARAGRGGTSTVFAFGWQLPIARQVLSKPLDPFDSYQSDNDKDNDDPGRPQHAARSTTHPRTKRSKGSRHKRNERDIMVKSNIEEKRFWI